MSDHHEDTSPLETLVNTWRTPASGRPEITLATPKDDETALRDFAKTLFAPEKD
jgi:hypothetical protein